MRYLFPLLIGVLGAAVLISLGTWQVQRLTWKEGVLAQIDARIGEAPVDLPANPDPQTDAYLPVQIEGVVESRSERVLASLKKVGAIHRHIGALETSDGRRVLIDLGYRPLNLMSSRPPFALGPNQVTVTGNLHWPDERDDWTPDRDARTGVHFARDLDLLAEIFEAEPLLIVARTLTSDPPIFLTQLPVTSEGIPNDHLQYAVTWFGLAIVWLGMTVFWLWRRGRRTD